MEGAKLVNCNIFADIDASTDFMNLPARYASLYPKGHPRLSYIKNLGNST
jgi:hypothetical protein